MDILTRQGRNCMPGEKVFLDTNIIIYAYDASAGAKHEIAQALLVDLWHSGRGVLSTQVLQEFFVNVIQKIPRPIDLIPAKNIVQDFLKWKVIVNDGYSVLEAIDICHKYGFSFWDSLIIEAAVRGDAEILLSEDLSDGQLIEGVTIKNPFAQLG